MYMGVRLYGVPCRPTDSNDKVYNIKKKIVYSSPMCDTENRT